LNLQHQVRFEKPAEDVLSFYAAADAYVGPSLEDAFNLPIAEAMACGLPVIASSQAGASEFIRDGQTGFILEEPRDQAKLAQLIRNLYGSQNIRDSLGQAAARYIDAHCTWDSNARMTAEVLSGAFRSHAALR
jgi:glycosyltransferase involved in cell wall biosynthesis